MRAWLWLSAASLCVVPAGYGTPLGVSISHPTNGAVYLQPTNMLLTLSLQSSVTPFVDGPRVEYYVNGSFIGSAVRREQFSVNWSNIVLGDYELFAVIDRSSERATSAVVRIRVVPGGHALIPSGAVWHYRDGGVDLGTEWSGTNVDIASWPSGPAKLGFGDDDVVTTLNFWTNNGEFHRTYYFRKAFVVDDPNACSNAVMHVKRDDGVIMYLNGTELLRDNMPEGDVNYLTLALLNVGSQEYEFLPWWIRPSRLRPGTNYLAIELHNSTPNNADVGFDMSLVVNVPVAPPSLQFDTQNGGVAVQWSRMYGRYTLESASFLSGQWTTVTAPVNALLNDFRVELTNNQPDSFFRLILP